MICPFGVDLVIYTLMRKILCTLFLFALSFVYVCAQKSWHVSNSLSLTSKGFNLTRLAMVMPVPDSDPYYQTIEHLSYPEGTVRKALNTDNTYLINSPSLPDALPKVGDDIRHSMEFDVTLYQFRVDMSQFETLYPYDTTSVVYRRYVRDDGVYVDSSNPVIVQISDRLWKKSKGDILKYAKVCYEYVASHFKYLNPLTGLHPLAELLDNGGGDCGNLSSIYVSLLHARKIPARHIATIRPDGSPHVWTDFYLERYGWIPVDVTFKQSDPDGDYFGYCRGDGIVMSKGICHQVDIGEDDIRTLSLLQKSSYWYWYKGHPTEEALKGNLNPSEEIKSSVIDVGTDVPVLRSIGSKTADLEWMPQKGADKYVIKVYGQDGKLLKTLNFTNRDKIFRIDGLKSRKIYTLFIASCRKVDNIETTMRSFTIQIETSGKRAARLGTY